MISKKKKTFYDVITNCMTSCNNRKQRSTLGYVTTEIRHIHEWFVCQKF